MKTILRVTSVVVFLFFFLQVIIFPVFLSHSYYASRSAGEHYKVAVDYNFVAYSTGQHAIQKSSFPVGTWSKEDEAAKLSLDGYFTALFQVEASRVYVDKGVFISSLTKAP
ncbi:MAG: hypothetical protein RIG68_15480 [Imperialibacter sp.]|uniref:hypothetical protein n=1 Tax=Imperialibacter sp. TaxID=2038411 RepID=UPI0032EFD786